MLNDILHPSQKDHIPAVGGVNDASGWKRLEKINSFIQQSPPLKPWALRDKNAESKVSNCRDLARTKSQGGQRP